MFTQPVFIRRNTPELRKMLEEIGIVGNAFNSSTCIGIHSSGSRFMTFSNNDFPHFNAIDCGTNEQLFLALAALRDDSDYMQWFTEYYGGMVLWSKCVKDKQDSPYRRKATPTELIEYFKTE